jgi:hypothetical protein
MKKLLATLMSICIVGVNLLPAIAFEDATKYPCPKACSCPQEQILSKEHICISKKAPVNTVTITNYRKIICKDNVLAVAFECKFFSKCAKAGDIVKFVLPQSIYTEEGNLVLPAKTRLIAEVTSLQQPKWFNKNARVGLHFRCFILPDGRTMAIAAKPFDNCGKLMEGPWMTAGKIVLSTVTLGIIGTGAGVGFGFIPSPTRIWTGIAVGLPAGAGLGLITALVTKGLHYKAKACEEILIILTCDTSVYN